HLQIVPYQLFATANGYIVLAVGNDGQWQRFCHAALGEPGTSPPGGIANDPRFTTNPLRVQHRAILIPLLEPLLQARTTAQWQELLTTANVPHAPVCDYAQVFALPQAEARGLSVTVRDHEGKTVDLVNSPFRIDGTKLPAFQMPPRLGQDSNSVLRDLLEMDPQAIAELRRRGIV